MGEIISFWLFLEHFDFSIFVDSDHTHIQKWYVERFLKLKSTAFQQTDAYFKKYSNLTDIEAIKVANELWNNINYINLIDNILPTRQRASLIIRKSANHYVDQISLRKL